MNWTLYYCHHYPLILHVLFAFGLVVSICGFWGGLNYFSSLFAECDCYRLSDKAKAKQALLLGGIGFLILIFAALLPVPEFVCGA